MPTMSPAERLHLGLDRVLPLLLLLLPLLHERVKLAVFRMGSAIGGIDAVHLLTHCRHRGLNLRIRFNPDMGPEGERQNGI